MTPDRRVSSREETDSLTLEPLFAEVSDQPRGRFGKAVRDAARAFAPPGGLIKNVMWLGGSTAVGQLLVVVSTPVITRLYTPTDLGLIGLVMAYVGFVSVATALRYEMAIVSAPSEREADTLLAISLFLTLPVAALAGLLLFLMIRGNILSFATLPYWAAPAALLIILLTGVFTSLRYWCVRRSDFVTIGRGLVTQGVGRSTVPVALGLGHVGWAGLLIGEMVGRSLGISELARRAWPALKSVVANFDSPYYAQTLKRNWKFPAMSLPSSLIDSLYGSLPLTIVATLFGSAAAGEFLLVQRIASLPASLVAASVGDVIHSHAADTHLNNKGSLQTILWNGTRKLGMVALLIYVPLTLISPFVFGIVFGRSWTDAGFIMAILSPSMFLGTIVSPLSRLLIVTNRLEMKLASDVVKLAVPLIGLVGMSQFGFQFWHCLLAFGILDCGSNLFYWLQIWRCSKRASQGTRLAESPSSQNV